MALSLLAGGLALAARTSGKTETRPFRPGPGSIEKRWILDNGSKEPAPTTPAGEPGTPARARVGFAFVCASALAYAVVETGSHVVIPPFLVAEYGFSVPTVGLLLSLVGGSSLAARFPVGRWYGRGWATPSAAIGALAVVAAMSAFVLSRVPATVGLSLVALGVGISVISTLQLATLASLREGRGRLGAAIGWYTAAIGAGHAVGGVLAGSLADSHGYGAVYWTLAAVGLAGTGLWLAGDHQTRPPADSSGRTQAAAADSARPGGRRMRWRSWDRVLVAAFSLTLVINILNGAVTTFHPIMAVSAGLSLGQVGLLASARSIASSVTRVGAGLFLTRSNGERLVWPLLVLGAGAIAALGPLRASFVAQIPLFALMGTSRGLLRITGSAMAMAGRPSRAAQGRASAALNSGLDLGKLVGPLVGSGVVSIAGLGPMFVIVGIAGLAVYAMAGHRSRR